MMNNEADPSSIRLVGLPLPAKVLLTLFLMLVGTGYLVAVVNIYEHHRDADLKPGLTIDDLRRVYHGLATTVTQEERASLPSPMLKMVSPGGAMRKHLEQGGEPAVRALVSWLKDGAKEATFAEAGVYLAGDPSAREVIAQRCVRCHNAADGENPDVPYAPDRDSAPQYALVTVQAAPRLGPMTQETKDMQLAAQDRAHLVQVTHAHVLAIPVFTLIVGGLFLLTGLPPAVKLILGPLPMLAICCDFASWWLARPFEPFIYVIAAAGAVFGASFGAQVLCVAGSLWFGRRIGNT